MWLHIPSTQSTPSTTPMSVPADQDSDWHSKLSSVNECALYSSSSGKPTPQLLSWRGWKTKPWIRLLSGIRLNPLAARRGIAAWISSLPVSRANLFLLPANVKAPVTNDGYGTISSVLFASFDAHSCTWRTSQASLLPIEMAKDGLYPLDCGMFLETWPRSGSMQNGSVYARKTSVPRMSELASSFWATPVTSRAFRNMEALDPSSQKDRRLKHTEDLTSQTMNWSTPRASDRDSTRKDGRILSQEASQWGTPRVTTNAGIPTEHTGRGSRLEDQSAQWSTPKALTGGANSNRESRNAGGSDLQEATQKWATPVAHDDNKSLQAHLAMKQNMPGGPRSAITSLNVQTKAWATPKVVDVPTSQRAKDLYMSGQGLEEQTQNWMTPRVVERGQYQRDGGEIGQERLTLDGQASQWNTPHCPRPNDSSHSESTYLGRQAQQWATPQQRDAKSAHASEETMDKNSRPLNEAACRFSLPVQGWVVMASSMTFENFSEQTLEQLGNAIKPNSETPSNGAASSKSTRRLNPLFSTWLMNFPLGWANALQPVESTSFALWEEQSSQLLRLWLSASWRTD